MKIFAQEHGKELIFFGIVIIAIILIELFGFNREFLLNRTSKLEERHYTISDGSLYQFVLKNGKLVALTNDPNITFNNINISVGYLSISCNNSIPGATGQIFYSINNKQFNGTDSITYPDDTSLREKIFALPNIEPVSSIRFDLTDTPNDKITCRKFVINPHNFPFNFNLARLAIYLGLLSLAILYIFRNTRPINNIFQKIASPLDNPLWAWLYYAFPMILVWVVYLLAYWPGSMSFDSINQWEQMITFKFSDWHPVFHTLTNWLITRLWLSPAAVAIVQILALSLVIAWGLVEQRRFGAPRWLPWVVVAIFIIIPSTGLFAIVLWKDVFYSISILALTILVFKMVMSQGEWIQHRAVWFYFGISAALVALYRQNGPPVAFGTLLILLIVYRQAWKRYLLALALSLVLWIGVRGPVYRLVGVDLSSASASNPGMGISLIHLISRYTQSDTPILPQEQSMLMGIYPEKIWPYDCYLDVVVFSPELNWQNLEDHQIDLAVESAKLIYRNPGVFVDHLLCNSSFIYQITQPPGSIYERIQVGIIPNQLGLSSESKLPGVEKALDAWIGISIQDFDWIFWRVPLWDYLFLAGIVIYWVRSKNWKISLITVPIMLNMLPLALATAGQGFRYVFSTLLVGVLMIGFLFSSDHNKNNHRTM